MKLALFVLLSSASALGAVNQSCAGSRGAEPVITIHGRLAVYNGGYPNYRLWHIGTHHLCGIYGNEDDGIGEGDREEEGLTLPPNVNPYFEVDGVFSVALFGDSVIRPLHRYRRGAMQPACILSATHLVRRVRH